MFVATIETSDIKEYLGPFKNRGQAVDHVLFYAFKNLEKYLRANDDRPAEVIISYIRTKLCHTNFYIHNNHIVIKICEM